MILAEIIYKWNFRKSRFTGSPCETGYFEDSFAHNFDCNHFYSPKFFFLCYSNQEASIDTKTLKSDKFFFGPYKGGPKFFGCNFQTLNIKIFFEILFLILKTCAPLKFQYSTSKKKHLNSWVVTTYLELLSSNLVCKSNLGANFDYIMKITQAIDNWFTDRH